MTEDLSRKTENVGRKTTMNHDQAMEELRRDSVVAFSEKIDELDRILQPHGNKGSWILVVARRTGLPPTTVEAYQKRKRKSIPSHIREYVEQILDAYNQRKERQIEHENKVLKQRLAALHAALTVGTSDPEFHSAQADAIGRQVGRAGGGDASAVRGKAPGGAPDRAVD